MAGLGLSLDIKGAAELTKKLASKTIKDPLQEGIKKITQTLLGLVKKATVVDMGELRSGITHKIEPFVGRVGTNVKYASFVEKGTRPHFPPVEPIEEWAQRHGMKGAGFAIARAISKRGTQAAHMMGGRRVKGEGMFAYGLEKLKDKLPNLLKGIGKDIKTEFDK